MPFEWYHLGPCSQGPHGLNGSERGELLGGWENIEFSMNFTKDFTKDFTQNFTNDFTWISLRILLKDFT